MSATTIGYYQFDAEEFSVALVLKEFWDVHKGLDGSGTEEESVPEGFFAIAEGIYEHEFDSTEEAKVVLEEAGWVEHHLFA